MDGVVRRGPAGATSAPVASRPAEAKAQPVVQPRPVQRRTEQQPVAPVGRPVSRPQQAAPVARQQPRAEQPAPVQERAPRAKKSHRGLKIFFQTLLALVVIIGVAVAIVVLYLRYYQ